MCLKCPVLDRNIKHFQLASFTKDDTQSFHHYKICIEFRVFRSKYKHKKQRDCLVIYHPVNGYKMCLEYLVLRSECEKFQLALRARISVGLQVDIHPVHGYKECLEYQLFRSEYQKLSALRFSLTSINS